MNFEETISYGTMSFLTADFEKAISYAKEARKLEPDNPEPYELMAKSYQALGKTSESVHYFKKAVECDVNNGNRYVELGIAYGSNEQPAEALESFAEAERLNCSDDYRGGMYRTLALVDYDIGRYEDAAANFTKAQKYLEPDTELLMYKALSYSMAGNISKAVLTVNQIKQLAPLDYSGYKLAYTFYMHFERFEDAVDELSEAQEIMTENEKNLPMDFYFDYADLLHAKYEKENDEDKKAEYLSGIIETISKGLKESKPDINEVVNAYIQSADTYIQLAQYADGEENKAYMYNYAVNILNAVNSPAQSFNSGFLVMESVLKTEYPEDKSYFENSDYQQYSEDELQMLSESALYEKDNNSESETKETYKLDVNEPINYSDEIRERVYMLYISAYTGLKDYKNVLRYVNEIKDRNNIQVAHVGKYLEAKTYADMGENEKASELYKKLIEYYRRAVIKDPSDLSAVSYRVQCYIDLGEYSEARNYCHSLSESVRKPLLEQISRAESAEKES